jgi:hypothetical protein
LARLSFARDILGLRPVLSSSTGPVHLVPVDNSTPLIELTSNSDHNNIVGDWALIAGAYADIEEACASQDNNEFTVRRGVDSLLKRTSITFPETTVR